MNWNVERSAILTVPDPFVRTINAVRPDVLLLQEITDKTTNDDLRAFAAQLLPADPADGGQWHTIIGKGGGDLRCGIISRLPLTAVPALDPIMMIEQPDRSVRAVGALIHVDNRNLLATSVHLKCCGRLGSSEDQARLSEVAAIHAAVRRAIAEFQAHGAVLAGDFNLVGSREPLENLQAGLDLDGSPLSLVDAYQIDGRSNATWADRAQPFVPGRLDYAALSDSSLEVRGCFVYDAQDITARWRETHGILAEDTTNASDHLPLVLDIGWKPVP
jgi:endonuclease/exonuclease/phosphatase family metal-dependent hydrolase